MSYSFGKLTTKKLTIDGADYLGFYNSAGVEWHDLFPTQPKFDHYIAVDDDGIVVSMEEDPEHSQITGFEIIGIWETETGGFKNINNGNTVYGCKWDGSEIQAKPISLADISDRQFFQQLAVMNMITQDEALSAVTVGSIPAAMQAFIDQLPADQRFPALMVLKGATSFQRNHPLVAAFGAGIGMSSAQIDALWQAAALL